jgi:hypothetical protein
VLSLCAPCLLQEGLEVGGLPLAARPEFHALVKDGDAGVVQAVAGRVLAVEALPGIKWRRIFKASLARTVNIRVARFSSVQHTNQNGEKCTK